jgi:hypothetical protein
MIKRRSLIAAAFAIAGGAAALPAADSFQGTATFNAEKTTLTHGLASWNASKREASLGFFATPPDAASRAKAAKEGLCCMGWPTPYVVLDLRFQRGATAASPSTLEGCHIGFYKFKDSPFDFNGFPDKCGAAALSGELKPGGVIKGKLKGNGASAAMGPFKASEYAWDLTFTVTLRAAPP